LLVVPLIILSFLAVVSGYLNAAPFKIEEMHHWLESSIGVELPEAAHFEWINAVPSIALVVLGFLVSLALCKAVFGDAASRLKGLTERSKLLGAGHRFLVNKYYLDVLYENVIVRAVAHPIAKAAYWVNQNVLDAIVDAFGVGGKKSGDWIYKNIDQRVVDGAVDGSGSMARGTGGALRPLQSGKVNQYGALLFGAAAVAALVLVIVNT